MYVFKTFKIFFANISLFDAIVEYRFLYWTQPWNPVLCKVLIVPDREKVFYSVFR